MELQTQLCRHWHARIHCKSSKKNTMYHHYLHNTPHTHTTFQKFNVFYMLSASLQSTASCLNHVHPGLARWLCILFPLGPSLSRSYFIYIANFCFVVERTNVVFFVPVYLFYFWTCIQPYQSRLSFCHIHIFSFVLLGD